MPIRGCAPDTMRRFSQLALRRLLPQPPPPPPAAASRTFPPHATPRHNPIPPSDAAAIVSRGLPLLRLPSRVGVAASGGRSGSGLSLARRFCTIDERDERALEEEADRKFGWLLKIFFLVTAGLVGYEFFPYMAVLANLNETALFDKLLGDNLVQQSISLLRVKDPLFKRMGASRLARFAVDDERRMKLVEMGAAQELLNVLDGAKDDKTRKQALKALVALSHSEQAARFLDKAGAGAIVISTADSSEFAEIESYKTSLLERFEQVKS